MKEKNVITLKQKNVTIEADVFSNLKQTFKRGNGLSKPSTNVCYNVNLNQKENNEAVQIDNNRERKRIIRISTYISKEINDLLDEIIIKIKRKEKKKPKINEILEKAIQKLYDELEN